MIECGGIADDKSLFSDITGLAATAPQEELDSLQASGSMPEESLRQKGGVTDLFSGTREEERSTRRGIE